VELREENFKQLVDEASDAGYTTELLHADLFRQLTTGAQSAAHLREKRDATRLGVRYDVIVRPSIARKKFATTPFKAELRDLSSAGIGLISPIPLHAKFTIEMPSADGTPYVVTCTARSSQKLGEGAYQIGATFDGDLAPSANAA
jgi:hypothetical protein